MLSLCCRRSITSKARKLSSISKMSFYDITDKTMDGQEVKMSDYKGSVLLFVNVASKWGLTKLNYTQLPTLSDEYGPKGLKILAFPCNQFGAQEPGSAQEIKDFVKKFDANMEDKLTFFEKGDVNGDTARDVYKYLTTTLPNEDGTVDIAWNFGMLYWLNSVRLSRTCILSICWFICWENMN